MLFFSGCSVYYELLMVFCRQGAFPGYSETAAGECSDEMEADLCESYLYAGMCDKAYVKGACLRTCDACDDAQA